MLPVLQAPNAVFEPVEYPPPYPSSCVQQHTNVSVPYGSTARKTKRGHVPLVHAPSLISMAILIYACYRTVTKLAPYLRRGCHPRGVCAYEIQRRRPKVWL